MKPRAELCSLNPLHQEVASLRDDIVHRISNRFPAEETFWMSLLNFSQGKYLPFRSGQAEIQKRACETEVPWGELQQRRVS